MIKLRILTVAAGLTYVLGASGARAEPQTSTDLCAAEWPTDYVMQEHCIGQMAEAVIGMVNFESELANFEGIIAEPCKEQWLPDFVMTLHCYKSQDAAAKLVKKRLDAYGPDDPEAWIILNCAEEWSKDYKMIVHCFDKQNAARKRIGQ